MNKNVSRILKIMTIIAALLLETLLPALPTPVGGSVTVKAAESKKAPKEEHRFSFQLGDLGGGDYDHIHMGEKVQPFYSMDQLENYWSLGMDWEGNDMYTADYDGDTNIPFLSGSVLPVEPYTITSFDLKKINNLVTENWTDKLFSEREMAILNEGTKKEVINEPYLSSLDTNILMNSGSINSYSEAGELADYIMEGYKNERKYSAGNIGLKVWGAFYSGSTSSDFDYTSKERKEYGKTSGPVFPDGDICRYFPLNSYSADASDINICGYNWAQYESDGRVVRSGSTSMYARFFSSSNILNYVRAECSISNNRIVIRSDYKGKHCGPLGPDAMTKVDKKETHEWKLTLLEDDRHFRVVDTKIKGRSVTVRYSGAKTGENEYILVIFEKGDDLWYGRVAKTSKDRTATVNLPYEFTRDCSLYVFNEAYMGDGMTDFCSNIYEVYPTSRVTFDTNGGEAPSVPYLYAENDAHIGELPTTKRSGYVFTGWYEDSSCTGTPITADTGLDPALDYTLYAGWKKYSAADEKSDEKGKGSADGTGETEPAGTVIRDEVTKTEYKIITVNVKEPEVEYQAPAASAKKSTKVVIPDTVTIDGIKYKVTTVSARAFKNNKTITEVIIGKNVRKIGAGAFAGCNKLKKLTFKTALLTKKSVGKGAFKGIHAKAVAKVPKKVLKKYKEILKAKGMNGKKQKIKKYK